MGEKPDEHQRAERGRVPAARPAEPGVGQHRSEDSDELELRVHARGAPVRELEVADGEQRGGDDPGKRVTAHPPGEQSERAYRAHDGWQPEGADRSWARSQSSNATRASNGVVHDPTMPALA